MRKDQLQGRCVPQDQLMRRLVTATGSVRGPITPASEIMSTVRGKCIHIKRVQREEDGLDAPIIGLCGAGEPNVEFPTGSGVQPEKFFQINRTYRGLETITTETELFAIVDCYKCIKLKYINQMREEELDIPTREFVCSDIKPTYESYGDEITLKEMNRIDFTTVSSIKSIQNIFVIYFKTSEELILGRTKKYKKKYGKAKPPQKKRVHIKVKDTPQEIEKTKKFFIDKGFGVRDQPPAREHSYDRRYDEAPRHVMIPGGRFGILGAGQESDVEKMDKIGEKTNSDFEVSEVGLEWVADYFDPKNNPWQVGTTPSLIDGQIRRTQQDKAKVKAEKKKKKTLEPFTVVAFNIMQVYSNDQLAADMEQDYNNLLRILKEYESLLLKIPIETFYGTYKTIRPDDPLFSIYKRTKSERSSEFRKYEDYILEEARYRTERGRIEKMVQEIVAQILDPTTPLGKKNQERLEEIGDEDKQRRFAFKAARAYLRDKDLLPERKYRKKKKTIADVDIRLTNPSSNRVLPMVERLEELDTMLLDLEDKYAQSRRYR